MFSFAIARVPLYTTISNFWNSCSQRFEVGIVLNSTNYFLSTQVAYGALLWISLPSNVYVYIISKLYIHNISKVCFFFWFLVCMLCRSKCLIIPNSQGPETLNYLVSLTCRTLDVTNRLFSRVLTQTQSLGTYIHFAISILCTFFISWDHRYPYNFTQSTPTHTHFNAPMYVHA